MKEKLWRCTAKHEHKHEAEVCKRVHSSATPWWSRAPGYLAEEIAAERSKSASKPVVEPEGTRYGLNAKSWAETWRETWQWAQRANARVTYATRADFLADVAAHHKLTWEIGFSHKAVA
jgi:hypothetical protein